MNTDHVKYVLTKAEISYTESTGSSVELAASPPISASEAALTTANAAPDAETSGTAVLERSFTPPDVYERDCLMVFAPSQASLGIDRRPLHFCLAVFSCSLNSRHRDVYPRSIHLSIPMSPCLGKSFRKQGFSNVDTKFPAKGGRRRGSGDHGSIVIKSTDRSYFFLPNTRPMVEAR